MAFNPNVNNSDLNWAPGADRPSNEYDGWHWDPSYGMYVQDAGTDSGGDPNVNNANTTFDPGSQAPSNPPPDGWVWDANQARYVPSSPAPDTPAAPEQPAGGGGGGGGGGGLTPAPAPPTAPGSSYTPPAPPPVSAGTIAGNPPSFNAPSYTPPPAFTYGDFNPTVGKDFTYQDFVAPTADSLYSDPSYQLRFGMGQQALENSKSAQGVVGTGGSIKDFINYGQNFASQEYANKFSRDLDTYNTNRGNAFTDWSTSFNNEANAYAANRANAVGNYNTNYGTQYIDPYQIAFQNAQAKLQPEELAYTTQTGTAQHDQDQSDLYGFNNKVLDTNTALTTQSNAFDEWYKKFLLNLQVNQ
jgi:hypothetical protein